MAFQSATSVLVALMRETTFGTPATPVSGADRLRMLDSPGLKMTRANIASAERRSDELENIGRLGGKSVSGSYNTEINPGGDFDLLIEDLVRGTWGALAEVTEIDDGGVGVGTRVAKVQPPATAVLRSYTVEQYDQDIDQTEQFVGVRVQSGEFTFNPGEMAQCSFSFMGQDRNVLTTANSPYFTAPALTAGIPLIADDAEISYKGSQILTATGLSFSVAIDVAGQPVVGSFVTPEIFSNMLRVSGNLSAIREDLAALDDFDAETEFEIKAVLQAPGSAPRLTFGVIMRRCKLMDIDAPVFGGDAGKVETRQFSAYPQAGDNNPIEFYSSTETPVIV